MSYPQQPGNWPEQQSWPQQYGDPAQQASGVPASPAAGYAGYAATPGYPAAQASYPGYGYAQPPMVVAAPSTNGMAIASLILSLAGLLTCGVTAIIGAILGHVARKQIRERGEQGDGLALGGIISGWIIFALYGIGWAIYIIFFVILIGTAATLPTIDPTPFPS